MQQYGAQLSVKAKAREVRLIDNTSGRWEMKHSFGLAVNSP
jgi:hypothetical protein